MSQETYIGIKSLDPRNCPGAELITWKYIFLWQLILSFTLLLNKISQHVYWEAGKNIQYKQCSFEKVIKDLKQNKI